MLRTGSGRAGGRAVTITPTPALPRRNRGGSKGSSVEQVLGFPGADVGKGGVGELAGFPHSQGNRDGGGGLALGLDGSLADDLSGAVLDFEPDLVTVGLYLEDTRLGPSPLSVPLVLRPKDDEPL